MLKFFKTVWLVVVMMLMSSLTGETIFKSDFESDIRFEPKIDRDAVKVNFLGVAKDMASGGEQAFKIDVTLLAGSYWRVCFPIQPIELKPDFDYQLRCRLFIEELPASHNGLNSVKIGLGWIGATQCGQGPRKCVGGALDEVSCLSFEPTQTLPVETRRAGWLCRGDRWIDMEVNLGNYAEWFKSPNLNAADQKIVVDKLYLSVRGKFFLKQHKNKRVVFHVDDLELTSSPKTTIPKPLESMNVPERDRRFVFGLYGPVSSLRLFREAPLLASWRFIPDWKSRYVNAIYGQALYHNFQKKDVEEYLRLMDANKLFSILYMGLGRYYRTDMSYADCERVLNRFMKAFPTLNDNVIGIQIQDEPCHSTEALKDFVWEAKMIRERYDLPMLAIGQRGEFYERYKDELAINVFDLYSIRRSAQDPWAPGDLTLKLKRRFPNKPIWGILQAYGSRDRRFPTVGELRLMTYATVANGATGVFYYTYSNSGEEALVDAFGTPSALWEEMEVVGRRLTAVGPLLLNARWGENQERVQGGKTILDADERPRPLIESTILKRPDLKGAFVFVYNNDPKNRSEDSLVFSKEFIGDGALYDVCDRIPLPLERQARAFQLDAGEGRLLFVGSQDEFKRISEHVERNRWLGEFEKFTYFASPIIRNEVQDLAEARDLVKRGLELAKRGNCPEALRSLETARGLFVENKNRNTQFAKAEAALKTIRCNLSSSLNACVRDSGSEHFLSTEFFGKKKHFNAYKQLLIRLGRCYFTLDSYFRQGQARRYGGDIQELLKITSAFHDFMKDSSEADHTDENQLMAWTDALERTLGFIAFQDRGTKDSATLKRICVPVNMTEWCGMEEGDSITGGAVK